MNGTEYDGKIVRDENMDLSQIENMMREQKEKEVSEDSSVLLKDLIVETEAPVVQTPKKTPLELAKEQKELNGSGVVLSKEEIEKNSEKKLKSFAENDRREREFKEYVDDMDQMHETAKEVEVIHPPKTQLEMVEMMDELETVRKSKLTGSPLGKLKYLSDRKEPKKVVDEEGNEQEQITEEEKAAEEQRRNMIEIIIDKSGIGFEDIIFSEEEREKIRYANEIKLKEVKTLDISSITIVSPTKSFLDVAEEATPSLSATTVSLPGSRYRVPVRGLTYGQLGDIVLTDQTKNFDRIHKQYSIIYNSLGTPNIGKFENFEDFLRKTAFTDMDMLLYGLIVSTFPEIETMPLRCNRCGHQFQAEYIPRTLLDLENCSDAFLQNIKSIIDCEPERAVEFNKDSFLNKRKVIELPMSKYLIEIGLASAYEYLYNMVDYIFGESFKEQHPEDTNGILQFNTAFITMIRGVYVPAGNGSYIQYTNTEDIIQALYHVKVDEFPMISNIVGTYTDEYTPQFSFKNVTCPNCKIVTPRVGADLNNLVFRKYQRLLSTEINVENIL